MKASLKPLKPREIYVVVRSMKEWREYPLPATLVAKSTVKTIFEPINDCPYVLAFLNFPATTEHVDRKDVYVFSYDAHACHDDTFGLTPAFGP